MRNPRLNRLKLDATRRGLRILFWTQPDTPGHWRTPGGHLARTLAPYSWLDRWNRISTDATWTRLLSGPRGGVVTTATLRNATNWDQLVRDIGQPGLVRHGLRHTALTCMADAGVELHILQWVAGHQDPAVTSRYLHPDVQAMLEAGARFSAWWSPSGPQRPTLAVVRSGRTGA